MLSKFLLIVGLFVLVTNSSCLAYLGNIQYTQNGFTYSISSNQLQRSISLLNDSEQGSYHVFDFVTTRKEPQPTVVYQLGTENWSGEATFKGILRGNYVWSVYLRKDAYQKLIKSQSKVIFSIDSKSTLDTSSKLSLLEKGVFSGIVNKKQIASYNNAVSRKTENVLEEEYWFKPDSQYVKISTKKDGIAKVLGSQLIKHQPQWLTLPFTHLHLLKNGKEQRYAEANDNKNGKLDINDTLVFIGTRTIGDSTWNDLISDESVYFFMKNESVQSLVYNWVSYEETNDVIESAQQEFHVEKNNWFFYGNLDGYDGVWNTESKHGKGFYWSENGFDIWSFTYPLVKPLFATVQLPQAKSDVTLTAVSNVSIGNYQQRIDEKISFLVNGSSIIETNQEYQGKLSQTTTVTSPLVGTCSLGFYADTARFAALRLLPDYFHIKGRFAPDAQKGSTPRLGILSEDKTYKLISSGFNDKRVIFLDSITGEAAFAKTTKGVKYAIIATKPEGYKSITINDSSVHYSLNNGWNIVSIEAPFVVKSTNEENQALQLINNAPLNSVIAIVASEISLLPTNIKEALNSLGLSLNSENPNTYCGIIIKGTNEKHEHSTNTFTSVNGFFETNTFNCFKANVVLKKPSIVFGSDLTSAESVKDYSVSNTNLYDKNSGFESLIITPQIFNESAERLRAFRSKQGFSISVIHIEDIYNQFGNGQKSPKSIKNFLRYVYQNWKAPRLNTVLLFGNASWDPLKLLPTSTQSDFIPTYGVPVSDFWYGLIDGNDLQSELIIGRLTPSTTKDAENLVDKLIEYDTMSFQPWMKNFGSFSQINGAEDFSYMYEIVEDAVKEPPIGGYVVKESTTSINGDVKLLRDVINNGVVWLNYSGHGSTNYFGLDGWQAENLNNASKYFLLGTHSCQTGAFADPAIESRNESYVNSAKKGAIAANGDSGWGETTIASEMMHNMYYGFANDSLRFLGELTYRAKWNFGGAYTFSAMQFSLVGDPLTRLRVETKPELYVRNTDVNVKSQRKSDDVTESDSTMTFEVNIHNAGIVVPSDVKVQLILNFESESDTLFAIVPSVWAKETTQFTVRLDGKSGRCNYEVFVNYDTTIKEKNYSNNIVKGSFTIFSQNAIAFDPQNYWSVASSKPLFRFLTKPGMKNVDFEVHLLDGNKNKIAETVITNEEYGDVGDSLYVDWKTDLQLIPNNIYFLNFRTKNRINQKESSWSEITFNTFSDENQQTHHHLRGEYSFNSFVKNNIVKTKLSNDTDGLTFYEKKDNLKIAARNGGNFGQIYINGDGKLFLPDQQSTMLVHKKPFDTLYRIKQFHTWTPSYEEGPFGTNTRDLCNYVKDSISTGEMVGIGFSSGAFRGFLHAQETGVKDAINVDSLIKTMRMIGAQKIDSVFRGKFYPNGDSILYGDRYAVSYALIGIKGNENGINEKFDKKTDTVTIEANVATLYKFASTTTPIIGEACKWENVKLDGENIDTSNTRISVIGYNLRNEQIGVIKEAKGSMVSLTDIDARTVSSIQIKIDLERTDENKKQAITGVQTDFTPLAEVAVIPGSLSFNRLEYLRGDTLTNTVRVRNLSLRTSADTCLLSLRYEPLSQNGSVVDNVYFINSMKPNESYELETQTETSVMGSKTLVRAGVQQRKFAEYMFGFNNNIQGEISVFEDKEPPQLQVACDSIVVNDGDYILPEPTMTFTVYDNSNLRIDSTRILVRINGRLLPSKDKTENASFTNVFGQGTKRGVLSFKVRNLIEAGDNNVRVIVEDASANRDTVTMKLWVASENTASDLSVYPNPSNANSFFEFEIRTQQIEIPLNVKLFDQRGRLVRTLQDFAHIGKNTLSFDGKDQTGNDLPIGLYTFIVEFYGQTYTNPIYGNLMIVR